MMVLSIFDSSGLVRPSHDGIAEVLLTLGYSVSGSDVKPSTITERLQNLGATIFEGTGFERGCAHVVVSSAVKQDNTKSSKRTNLIPVIRARRCLRVMRLSMGMLLPAHKTTTTSMVARYCGSHSTPRFVVAAE